MNKVIISLFLFFFIPVSLFSQDFDIDENLQFEEVVEEEDRNLFLEFIDKNISGQFGFSYTSFSDVIYRQLTFFKLSYEQDFDWLKLNLSGEYTNSEIGLSLKKQDCTPNSPDFEDCKELPEEQSFVSKSEVGAFREAYIDLDFIYASLSAGYKVIVWGQFEVFSPIDFALPIRLNSFGTGLNKTDRRLSQRVVQLNVYPYSDIEISYYYFPYFEVDPQLDEVNQKRYTDFFIAGDNNNLDTHSIKYFEEETITPENEAHSAARILFYQNWGTIGLTYAEVFSFFPESTTRVMGVDIENINDDGIIVDAPETCVLPALNQTSCVGLEQQSFNRTNIGGIELAVPSGNWTWKFEYTYQKIVQDLNITGNGFYNDGTEELNKYIDFFNWALEDNEGRLYLERKQNTFAAGFDYNSPTLVTNFTLYYVQYTPFTSTEEVGLELAKDINEDLDEAIRKDEAFPAFNITSFNNEDREAGKGMALGILGAGAGVSFYYFQEFLEAFTINGALDIIQYFGNSNIVDVENYELVDDILPGIRVSMLWNF